jgi:putative peptidoglycan lipid II flippase
MLGFLREGLFGKYFGTTSSFDAFTVSFSVIMFAGSFLTVIPFFSIPALAETFSKGNRTSFSKQLSSIALVFFTLVAAVVLVGEVWAERIVLLTASGLEDSHTTVRISVTLMRVSFPILFLLALAQLFRALLNLFGVFAIPSLEGLFFNAGLVATILFARKLFDFESPLSISFGYYFSYLIFGSLCILILFPLTERGTLWHVDLQVVRKIIPRLVLVLVSVILNSLNSLVLTWHASHLSQGAISGLGYVNRLLSFSIGGVVGSLMVVFLPTASIARAQNFKETLRVHTEKLVHSFLLLSTFVAAFVVLNGKTLVEIVYSRGLFDETSSRLVSGLLYCYIPWIIFFPLSSVSARLLYVHRDYRKLTLVSAAGLALTLSLAPALRKGLGVNGLGLTSSFHMFFHALALSTLVGSKYVKIRVALFSRNVVLHTGLQGAAVLALAYLKRFALINHYVFFVVSTLVLGSITLWRLNESFDLLSILRNKARAHHE